MVLSIDIDNTTLDILSTRMKYIVSPLDILKWLSNFAPEDVPHAVTILSNMTVYTTYEVEGILDDAFKKLLSSQIPANHHLIVHPIGKFGKSGSMIAYLFQKTDFYKNNSRRITLLSDVKLLEVKPQFKYTFVMLDDFIGSGNSIKEYYAKIQGQLAMFNDIHFVGIAGMKKGVKNIEPLFGKVMMQRSNVFDKAFSADRSILGSRKHPELREMAYRYGQKLSTKTRNIAGTDKYIEALGYDNTQALVSFAYGSPNNTLPIIWANKNGWFPLFPRFSADKVSSARELRKDISYELSILKEFGSMNLKDNFFSYKVKKMGREFSSVSKIDFSIYGIIKLSRAGFTTENICQKLGILHKDYEEYIATGRLRGIFDSTGKLTLFGLTLFQEAKKCIERRKRSFELNANTGFPVRKINYTPSQFNGRS